MQRWRPNHWLNMWSTKVDPSIRTKRTPQQTQNQMTSHKTTNNNTTLHSDDEIMKKHKKKTQYMWKFFIYIERNEIKDAEGRLYVKKIS